jgi:hypothetical protein
LYEKIIYLLVILSISVLTKYRQINIKNSTYFSYTSPCNYSIADFYKIVNKYLSINTIFNICDMKLHKKVYL